MIAIPSIYIWSASSAILALLGLFFAHKFVKPVAFEENQALLDATLNIVGTLVSILLGLLVAASLSNYQTLEANTDAEASSISEMCRLAFGLPIEPRSKLITLCLQYCNEVVDDEWPAMAKGLASEKVTDTYHDILALIVTFKPSDNGETNVQSALITAMQEVGNYRRQRILWLHNNWNRNLLPVLILCSVIVLMFSYLYFKRGNLMLHSFLTCFVAAALGTNIGLVCLMSRPFDSDWQIQPKGFVLNTMLIHKYGLKYLLKTGTPNTVQP